LFPPGTTDANFSSSAPVDGATSVPAVGSADPIAVQAPYTGTFLLAVCQDPYTPCSGEANNHNPIDPYTFTTRASGAGHNPVRPSATITGLASSPPLLVGTFGSGGGANVDFWRVRLAAKENVKVLVTTGASGNSNLGFRFDLYPPGTTDANFASAKPVDGAASNPAVASADPIALQAPYAGTFVLAVCQDPYTPCNGTSNNHFLDPFTFVTVSPSGSASGSGQVVNGFNASLPLSPYGEAARQMLAQAPKVALVASPSGLICELHAYQARQQLSGAGLVLVWTVEPSSAFLHQGPAGRLKEAATVGQYLSHLLVATKKLYLAALQSSRLPPSGPGSLASSWAVQAQSVSTTGQTMYFRVTEAGGSTTYTWSNVPGAGAAGAPALAHQALANLLYYTKAVAAP
jgi:hypothetical protein